MTVILYMTAFLTLLIFVLFFLLFKNAFKDKYIPHKYRVRQVKDLSEKEKEVLKSQYEDFINRLDKRNKEVSDKNWKRKNERNSKCPVCSSTNINSRVKRLKGNIEGKGSGFSTLFYGQSSSYIKGSIDTDPVNKCNDCEHEWHKEEYRLGSKSEKDIANYARLYIWQASKIEKAVIDPNDLTEKFTSLKDKKAHLTKELQEDTYGEKVKEWFGNYSLELIQYLHDAHVKKTSEWDYDEWSKYNKQPLIDLGIKPLELLSKS